ncbi:Palmitoyltransferase pfa4 [Lecanosticta acicola]|uniref:Chromatin modification-related protein EAF6 n=1 Tax=Lecanosticta acicola TaxID=111012 RepID=A0AAI8Z6C8_9PEZI|nr:Palmitoyltransferase pfa4 [Lecanosticta acicola]
MSENVPPTSTAAANASTPTGGDQPGRPYYESLRSNLRQTLDKKRKLDEQLAALEDNIYKMEGAYLEETANSGNIVRGFDGWVKGVSLGGGGGGGGRAGGEGGGVNNRKGRARDEERIFSRSSVGWMRAQEGPDSNTPSHAPTPTGSFAPQLSARESNGGTPAAAGSSKGAAGNKKRRANEKDDPEEGNGKGVKRGKISYARE